MQEYPFPALEDLENARYRLFPPELENDPLVFFHATPYGNFTAITDGGFRLPEATRENQFPAVSFAKNSDLSLTLAMQKRRSELGEYVMFAVRYDSVDGLDDQGIDVHDRRLNTPPTIVGYCRIPESYEHR